MNAINVLSQGKIGALRTIEEKFEGNFEQAWHSDIARLINKEDFEQIRHYHKRIDPEREFEKLRRENIDILTIHDNNYPRLLREIIDPPFLLYVRGSRDAWQQHNCAVVGTRKASLYGKRATESIVQGISRAGFTIISGMALGIDTCAHKAALAEHRPTIAVLGCGIDEATIYPRANAGLAHQIIAEGGAIISEFPHSFLATRYSFPQRNRVVSGMSQCTLVIEADTESGSLITAKSAIDQNRDVFAVPGQIFSDTSRGTNWLIKNGATPVTESDDLLSHYNIESTTLKKDAIIPSNDEERMILAIMHQEPMSTDAIIEKTGLATSLVSATLVMMELQNKIKNLGNNMYVSVV